ncbi:AraC family transcriptional regulator [Pseudomonas sp. Marseille-QA0892]
MRYTSELLRPGTISAQILDEALLAYVQAGRSREELLDGAGFRPETFVDEDGRIPAERFGRLWKRLARRFDDEFFGMAPRPLRAGSFSFMARTACLQPDLGQALGHTLDYLRLMTGLQAELRISGSEARLTLADNTQRAFTGFTFWLIVHGLACWLVGRRVPINEVRLRASAPADLSDYRTRFGENLHFNAPQGWLALPVDALALPVRKGLAHRPGPVKAALSLPINGEPTGVLRSVGVTDVELAYTAKTRKAGVRSQGLAPVDQFLNEAPANLLVHYQDHDSLAKRVTAHLRALPPADWPDLDTMAAEQDVSPATLRRRLAEAGQPYQAIKDRLRRDMALASLADPGVTHAQIAARLGFADLRSFYKAFRKWTGTTPGAHQQRLGSANSAAASVPLNTVRIVSDRDAAITCRNTLPS